jgi:ubiquinone/menaquinone biosynthesis C-methylase UbiE
VISATARVAQAGLSNVRLIQGDAQTLEGIADGFDAAVGRLILMYLPDPATALRRAAGLVRPGGIVCFHEGDLSYDWAAPMTPLWTQMRVCGFWRFSNGQTRPPAWDSRCTQLSSPLACRLQIASGVRRRWWR